MKTTIAAERVLVPSRPPTLIDVASGPVLFADLPEAGTLSGHRRLWGDVPRLSLDDLRAVLADAAIAGRGGAGFPFAAKLALAATARRCRVVVNAAEGEPASAKDAALLTHAPHRVLDGAAIVARTLGVGTVDVVLPGDRPAVHQAVCRALASRAAAAEPVGWRTTVAAARFVSGQESAVLELLAGRPGMPVTTWAPAAQPDRRGRANLVSNAETWAHVAAMLALGGEYTAYGTKAEPGTTLLTLRDQSGPDGGTTRATVREVGYGTRWSDIVAGPESGGSPAILLGGFHGTWLPNSTLQRLPVSRAAVAEAGASLGAGVVYAVDSCPVAVTGAIVRYLADESARRCGPCRHGLPELADRVEELRERRAADCTELRSVSGLVAGRGACRHPDGTVRLVHTLERAFPDEVAAHLAGGCRW